MTLEVQQEYLTVSVIDNGEGIPENIRNSLFEPFVSEGKQKGTGLGLTLAHCIAVEHGGEVVLLSSYPGETIFQMTVAREIQPPGAPSVSGTDPRDEVDQHENSRA